MSVDRIVINGIDAITGQYLVEPMEIAELAQRLRAMPFDESLSARLSASLHDETDPHLGLPLNVRPEVVAEAGWGIVFHKDEAADVRDALKPLIDHRRTRIKDTVVKQLQDFRPQDDVPIFLARHGVGQGSVVPTKVPFYLLVIGGPDRIPFEFGHQLDVEYCVGRLHFDTAAEYSAYVKSVIEYETAATVPNAREAVFWSPRHPLDAATQLSADRLVMPLVDGLPAMGAQPPEPPVTSLTNFRSRKFWGKDAKKQALLDVFTTGAGAQPPAFLFTASHGVGFGKDDPRQRDLQGALLCQDWPSFKPIDTPHYLSMADVPDSARVHGLVSFHFACFAAGTPARDQFVHKPGQPPPDIAAAPFFARLPQRLLAHPNGGALACIGHVERAWGYSITTAGAGVQLLPFRNCIGRILMGQPVGFALKDFNERYASLTVTLTGLLQQAGFGVTVPDAVLASRWIERNDAEGYVVLGDPAVSLRVNDLL